MAGIRRPRVLVPGEPVGVAAPAGPFDRDAFEKGLAVLRGWDLDPIHGDDLFRQQGYLAGIDRRRRAELFGLFRDERLGAVFCARGGYGAMRLLEDLDPEPFARAPRLFVGFSDITALHAFFTEKVGMAVVHGPVVTNLGRVGAPTLEPLRRILFSPEPLGEVRLATPHSIREGRATGVVKGGNLSVLTRLLGTPFMPDLAGAVLFFEDVGERPYRLDRMLTHLRLAGALRRVAAVLVGELAGCEEPGPSAGQPSALDVVRERLGDLGVPVLAGFPAGHGAENHPLPFGLRVTVDATAGRLIFEEGFAPA